MSPEKAEQKVVQLHGRKRHLAEAVLEGQQGGAVSVEEVRELLRDHSRLPLN